MAITSISPEAILVIALATEAVSLSRSITIGRNWEHSGAARGKERQERWVDVTGIKLETDRSAAKVVARQGFHDAGRGRRCRSQTRRQFDFPEHSCGLRAAYDGPQPSDRSDDFGPCAETFT
jgi:hypothetical protein